MTVTPWHGWDLTQEGEGFRVHAPASNEVAEPATLLGTPNGEPDYHNTDPLTWTFEQTFARIYDEAFQVLLSRQAKYGPHNITQQGIYGVLTRIAHDKVQRVMRAIKGTLVDGVLHVDVDSGEDEDTFEDGLIDIANYALICLALRRGVWGAEYHGADARLELR